ncbi:hypothetical protein [Frigidibacter sp. MR17.24]|uniref:hypothetical protein n=1 Tax=Frigidibacter sp. MR17.24 TaxID=3127345 RepID=UPI003012F689
MNTPTDMAAHDPIASAFAELAVFNADVIPALRKLASYVPAIERVARYIINAFDELHADTDTEIATLELADALLSVLIENLEALPSAARVVIPPSGDEGAIVHADAAVRWVGSRTETARNTVWRALTIAGRRGS